MKLVLALILIAGAACAKKQTAKPAATPAPAEEKKTDDKAAPGAAGSANAPAAQGDPCEGGEATKH